MRSIKIIVTAFCLFHFNINAEIIYLDEESMPDYLEFLRSDEGLSKIPDEYLVTSQMPNVMPRAFSAQGKPTNESIIIGTLERRFFGNEAFMEELIKTATHIATIAQDDAILFLGRTPAFLKEAIEYLAKVNKLQKRPLLLSMNFSGTPDAKFKRSNTVEYDADFKNYVSLERLNYFCAYADEVGLRQVNGKLYIVDIIGSGGSLNSFLRLMRYYYRNCHSTALPDIHFLALNLSAEKDEYQPTSRNWSYSKGRITFQNNVETGWRPMTVDTIPLGSTRDFTLSLDDQTFQYLASPGVQFFAYLWEDAWTDYRKSSGKYWPTARALLQRALSTRIPLAN